jgi:signal transduction histidine kinase
VLPVRRADEIGALARSFTRMADRLGEADRMKEEFFSHISHELRTPLTSVREAVHLLRDRVAGPLEPKQARLVDIIGDGTERMLRLVNQILELTRLRAGLLAIDHRSVDVARLVARALEQLRPQAEARGVTLHQNGTPTAAVTGDEERLFQVALNLVGNAIKFTTTGGKVEVRVAERNGGVALTVEDDGVGIPADALPRIFEPYRQAHATGGGSGLGLAIVKGIVEAHGGRIEVASREGAGSRFTVTLPGREEA